MSTPTNPISPSTATEADFQRLISLQQLFSEADAKFDRIQAKVDDVLRVSIDCEKAEYAAAKSVRDEAEAEIKLIVGRHPEWLDGRSVKTPFGSVEFRAGSKIVVANEEATVALIDAVHGRPGSEWRPDQLVRTERTPNLDALHVLSDDQLAKIGARREKTESVTVKRAKVELGKKGKAPKTVPTTPEKAVAA